MLLHVQALCIKMHYNVPFSDENIFWEGLIPLSRKDPSSLVRQPKNKATATNARHSKNLG